MKTWLKGGLIGIGVSVFLYIISFLPRVGLLPFVSSFNQLKSVLSLTGIDYLALSLNFYHSLFFFSSFFVSIFVIFVAVIIGFLLEKEISLEKKIIVLIILVLLFVPLSGYSNFLKLKDRKILSENVGFCGGVWVISDNNVCNGLSIFKEDEKDNCLQSGLADKDVEYSWKQFLAKYKDKYGSMGSTICFAKFSIENNNIDYCDLTIGRVHPPVENSLKRECVVQVAVNKEDPSLCPTKEEDIDLYQNCIIGIVTKNKDISLCKQIEEPTYRSLCMEARTTSKYDLI